MSTSQLVAAICGDDLEAQTVVALRAIESVAIRPDCTFHQLLDMARAPVLEEHEQSPAYQNASLWQDGSLIHMRFCSLSLQEQIAAARHVCETYDHSRRYEGDATTTLMRFFLDWMCHSEDSNRAHLVEIIEHNMDLDQKQWKVFIDCFEFVAQTDQ